MCEPGRLQGMRHAVESCGLLHFGFKAWAVVQGKPGTVNPKPQNPKP